MVKQMSELVTCPKCKGLGTIPVYPDDVPETKPGTMEKVVNKIGENLDKFAYMFEDKPYWRKTTYKPCPLCRGFGMVRKQN
jgi:RecJ-like exonuclease